MGFVENVNSLAANLTTQNIENINSVVANEANINTVASNINDVNEVALQVVPNMAEILQADNNAATATAQAVIATTQVGVATDAANTATAQAGIATTKASEASTSADNAQLRAWEAEAERMTADSYATEAEDVFVKMYTSNGDGTFTATDTSEYSALHHSAKSSASVIGLIDDGTASATKVYSSDKTQALHDAQATAIANLSGASASFYNNTSIVIPEAPAAFVDLTWTNNQASTNSSIMELGTNELLFKYNGNYNFLTTLTYYRLSDDSVMTVTYELYDADTSTVLATYNQSIDMTAGTKETVPMNALLTISGASVANPVRVKVRMQATSASGTLELFSFNSIVAIASVAQSLALDSIPTDGSSNAVMSNGVFDALTLKSDTSHTHTTYLEKAGGTMTGAITALRETKVAMGANDIDLSAGNVFTKTISGATTLTVSNWLASGNANSFILELTNGGSAAITWFSGVKWAGGIAPTLTSSGVDILGFYSHDGGTTVRGILLAKDSK